MREMNISVFSLFFYVLKIMFYNNLREIVFLRSDQRRYEKKKIEHIRAYESEICLNENMREYM